MTIESATGLGHIILNGDFSHALVPAVVLFVIGLFGSLIGSDFRGNQSIGEHQSIFFKRSFSIQLMLLAVVLIFVAAGRYWQSADGQIVIIFLLVFAAIQMLLVFAISFAHNENAAIKITSNTSTETQVKTDIVDGEDA